MSFEPPKNPNYAATVIRLEHFRDLEKCDNIKGAVVFGNQVIVSKDAQAGDVGLFFPVETQLSEEFLGQNNLYRKPEWGNADNAKTGFFDQHGRVRCVKFRGHKSEGFFIPLTSLQFAVGLDNDTNWFSLDVGKSFDTVNGHEICRKYVPKRNPSREFVAKGRHPRLEDQIVPNQFRFHADTENLRRNIGKIQPSDYISISDKWHGTSVVVGKVLTVRKLPWYEKVLARLGVRVQLMDYGLVYSSRRVIKAVNGTEKTANHYYTQDIWGIVAKEVEGQIPDGYTVYGEIVGYTPDGSPIQKGYHYGCGVGQHKLVVYRVTLTNASGQVLELSWKQMAEFCEKYGFERVRELWYGKASAVDIPQFLVNGDDQTEQDLLLSFLEWKYVNDGMCPFNNNEVPAEGIVVRIDHLDGAEAYKLKSFKFLEWETKQLDKGEVDTETLESDAL